MRIKSRFKDYYDNVQSTGQDEGLLFLRYSKEVDCTKNYGFPSFHRIIYNNNLTKLEIENYAIGFCGKYYPCILLKKDKNKSFCYSVEDVSSFIEKNYKEKMVQDYHERSNKWANKYEWPYDISENSFCRYFGEVTNKQEYQNKAKKICEEAQTPIFIGCDPNQRSCKMPLVITYNAALKKVNFFKVFDAYQTFQEIAMWLSNQAIPLKEMPKISDETMSEIKGFDKFSFRKDSEK